MESMPRTKRGSAFVRWNHGFIITFRFNMNYLQLGWSKLKPLCGSCKAISQMMKLFFPALGVNMFWSSPEAVIYSHTHMYTPFSHLDPLIFWGTQSPSRTEQSWLRDEGIFTQTTQQPFTHLCTQGRCWASKHRDQQACLFFVFNKASS